jgi:hypothetical protein
MVAPVRPDSIATRPSRHGAAAGASVALAGRAGRGAFSVTGGRSPPHSGPAVSTVSRDPDVRRPDSAAPAIASWILADAGAGTPR